MSWARLLTVVTALALVLTGLAGADAGQLRGTVGPEFTIGLTDGSGAPVTHLEPGTFALAVDDKSAVHSFHLQGPGGVDVATDIEGVGAKTFSVSLVNGKYTFLCDAHPTSMKGTFTVGTVSEPPPTKTPPAASPAPIHLVLRATTNGLSLTTAAGARVKALSAAPAVITVRDRSTLRGMVLIGAGVNRKSGVGFVGTATWKMTLTAGTLVYSSIGRPVLRGGRVVVS